MLDLSYIMIFVELKLQIYKIRKSSPFFWKNFCTMLSQACSSDLSMEKDLKDVPVMH